VRALTGYESGELSAVGFEGWLDIIHPDDRGHVAQTLHRCLETHQPHTVDYRLRHKDGQYIPVLDRGRHVADDAGAQRLIGALIDLTSIRRQEQALRRSEERYRIIATQVGAVIVERDIASNRLQVHGPVEQIFGYTKEQMESRPGGRNDVMIHPDDRDRVLATVQRAQENLSSYYIEYRRRHRGGHYIHVAARTAILAGPDGRADRTVTAYTDITERKQAEERLSASEERFRLAAEQARQIVYEYALGDQLQVTEVRVAGAVEQILGLTAEALRDLQKPDRFRLIHPDDIRRVRMATGEGVDDQGQFHIEHRLLRSDGQYAHVENRGAVKRDAAGNIIGIVGMLLDISARKAAEDDRQQYTLQLGMLADIARRVSTFLSLHELLNYLSRSMRDLVGANAAAAMISDSALPAPGSVIAVSYADHYGVQRGEAKVFGSPELHEQLSGHSAPVRLTKKQTENDVRWSQLTQNDDLRHPLNGWLGVALSTRTGGYLGLLELTDKRSGDFTDGDVQILNQLAGVAAVAVENIMLYATLEERVAARTRELEISNRELEAFSYSVSHDLRAPLRAIAGFSSILEHEYGSKLDTSARRYLQRIGSGVERMASLIDDLLSLARVSRLDIKRETIDLTAMCRAIAKRQRERWTDREIDVKVDARMRTIADPRLVEVALENLIENAIKFTSTRASGQIHIGRRVIDGRAAFFVHDNGVGFDPQYASNLFGVFQRLHSATEFPGTGVGLATVQRIVQRHHGRVWAESKIDEGAVFYFTFESEA
jgi:PAS domain S-box-containing protein